MTKKCPKCGSYIVKCLQVLDVNTSDYYKCAKCYTIFTSWQQAEIESLKDKLAITNKKLSIALDGLQEIENLPKFNPKSPTDWPTEKQLGEYAANKHASQLADATLKAIAKGTVPHPMNESLVEFAQDKDKKIDLLENKLSIALDYLRKIENWKLLTEIRRSEIDEPYAHAVGYNIAVNEAAAIAREAREKVEEVK